MMKKIFLLILVAIGLITIVVILVVSTREEEKQYPSDITEKSFSDKTTGLIIIKTNPSDASVTIASLEDSFQATVSAPVKQSVPLGKYLVTAFKTKYENSEKIVEIKSDSPTEINIVLQYSGEDITEGAP